ncbi:MAG: stage II sporulation protein M [Candidatus Aenigmarchaeota archaeon]|nr:stage II sporulation protein M [Candidatus Aenigmarchaeota archaeon]
MVLDRIIGQDLLTTKPDVGLFLGFVFTLIGFATSYLIFVSGMSIAMIGFSSLLMLPYIIKIMKPESSQYAPVFSRKNPSLEFFAFLFLGMALAYTILFGILSPGIRDLAFDNQLDVIAGRAAATAGSFIDTGFFMSIFSNNILIVAIAVILSYFYGAGAIFVLNYNASIAGIVYGSWISALLWPAGPLAPFASTNIMLFLPHTILEILGYLLASVAGIILSKPLTRRNSRPIERDVAILVAASGGLILVGALVEVIVPFL